MIYITIIKGFIFLLSFLFMFPETGVAAEGNEKLHPTETTYSIPRQIQ